MNKTTGLLVGLFIVLLGVAGFMLIQANDTEDPVIPEDTSLTDTVPQATELDETTPDTSDEEAAEVADVEIDMTMESFKYSQGTIEANPGDTVTVNLSVLSGMHNFVIDELGIASDTITDNETDSVTFTIPADAAGMTYAFYCSVEDHRAQGMEGQLVISN